MIQGRNLWELVEARADATPDAVMLIDQEGDRVTFREYRDRAERAAAGFHQQGIREGDVVSWQLPTWPETIVLLSLIHI